MNSSALTDSARISFSRKIDEGGIGEVYQMGVDGSGKAKIKHGTSCSKWPYFIGLKV